MQIVTLRRLAALALIVAAPAAMAQSVQHTTGTVTFRVFANGYFGNALGVPATGAFAFNGINGLFEGQLLVGIGANQVAGQPYVAANAHEWTAAATPTAITPPSPFDQAFQGGPWTDGAPANPNPIGLSVMQRSYSSSAAPNNDFAIVELDVTTTLAQPALYIGIFADWDVGPTFVQDLAGYDPVTKLLYVFDNAAGNPNYYGVAVLGADPVSGYSDDVGAGTNPTQPQVWAAMTTVSPLTPTPADRRTVIGSGPFNLAAGATKKIRFAWVGGTSAADIIANAAAAQAIVFTAAEGGPNERGYALSTSPNPVSSSANVSITLPAVEDARVAVYDVTGREVALVLDGARAAGTHDVSWDASALPAGVYLVRLTAGNEVITRTISVTR